MTLDFLTFEALFLSMFIHVLQNFVFRRDIDERRVGINVCQATAVSDNFKNLLHGIGMFLHLMLDLNHLYFLLVYQLMYAFIVLNIGSLVGLNESGQPCFHFFDIVS